MEILLNTNAYTRNKNTKNYAKFKESQRMKKMMIQYFIRLSLVRNSNLICLSILSVTRLIVLFGIKVLTLWKNDVNVSSAMFFLNRVLLGFHVYQGSNFIVHSLCGNWIFNGTTILEKPLCCLVWTTFEHGRKMLTCYIRHCPTW